MNISRSNLRRHAAALAALGALALLAACGDEASGAPQASAPASSAPVTAAPTTEPATTEPVGTEPTTGQPASVDVAAQDYEFVGVPAEVTAGTQFHLANGSTTELHEMVAVRIPDGDDRPVMDILSNDLASLFAVPPSFVLLAPPGGDQITAVGDGVLTEPGRYALVCMIPTGIDPTVYLEAAAQSGDGPPQVEGGGAPHIFNGMYAEVTVMAD